MKATQTTPDPVEPQTTPTPTRGLPRRLVGGLARIAFTLVRLILKGLAAAITHYPRHALAAALSLVMLAAIAYTQNRDSKKPPINEVKAQDPKPNTQVAHNDQSPIITPKDPAKPDNQVGAVSLTEPGPPPPTTPTTSLAQAPRPDTPSEPPPTSPILPNTDLAAAEPPPTIPAPKPSPITENPTLPPPITPAQPLPVGEIVSLPPADNEPTLLAMAPSPEKTADEPKSSMPDLPPATLPESSNQTPPISSAGEPGPLFPAPVKKPDEPIKKPEEPVKKPEEPVKKPDEPIKKPDEPIKKPDEPVKKPDEPVKKPDEPVKKPEEPVKKPELPEPSKVVADPPKLPEPRPEAKPPEPKPEAKGLEPPAPVVERPAPVTIAPVVPEVRKPEPARPSLPEPAPVVVEEKARPAAATANPDPPAPEPAASPRTVEKPSNPIPAGWKELPNLGRVPLESGDELETAADPAEQAAGVTVSARDPRAHVARDVSFELEAQPTRAAAGDRPQARQSAAAEKIEATLHVVERKENFWTISRLYYGSGRYYKALWKANAEKCPKIDGLRVGDVIVIPAPEDLDSSLFDRLTANVRKTASTAEPAPRRPTPRDEDFVLPPASRAPATRAGRSTEDRETTEPDPTTHASARPRDPSDSNQARKHVYKVRPSDTLRSIARDTLGSSRRAGEILDLNPGLVDESGRLTAGQLIELPDDARVMIRR